MSQNQLKIKWIDSTKSDIRKEMAALRRRLSPKGNIVSASGKQRTIEIFGAPLSPQEIVEKVCSEVAENGISALLDYSRRIDRAELSADQIRVPAEEFEKAHKTVESAFLDSVRNIRNNIAEFQTAILHHDVHLDRPGGWLKERYRPLRRVGICVPGGAAAYPSSLLMTAIPAQVAGVKEIAVMAPPTPNGSYNPYLLAACRELGITEVYRMGGAQGVAAFAYGVEGIARVDKIVGPGNLFVALAKRHVFGETDIDSIAGPSEVVVIVDESTRTDYTAYDMLAQAEHAPGASILIGWNENALKKAVEAIEREIDRIDRGPLARQSLEDYGAVILANDQEEACRLTDAIAPEHLHIATKNAEELADKISCAGAIFLGNYTPVALGDYAAGPSHVLPTSGTARFSSGLTCNDFLRANSILHFDQSGLKKLAPDVYQISSIEGLTAHRESVEMRTKD
ncbi:MAG: histidinol dehydrogenase [Planctomycetia bacterium]|nr:histidinol dehydrogenase [Planctomycetia bacterium]